MEEEQVAKQEYEAKYTDPGLREKIKEEIKASDKRAARGASGAPASPNSSRKSTKKRGGGYKGQS